LQRKGGVGEHFFDFADFREFRGKYVCPCFISLSHGFHYAAKNFGVAALETRNRIVKRLGLHV
jgi:hypothetical protein